MPVDARFGLTSIDAYFSWQQQEIVPCSGWSFVVAHRWSNRIEHQQAVRSVTRRMTYASNSTKFRANGNIGTAVHWLNRLHF